MSALSAISVPHWRQSILLLLCGGAPPPPPVPSRLTPLGIASIDFPFSQRFCGGQPAATATLAAFSQRHSYALSLAPSRSLGLKAAAACAFAAFSYARGAPPPLALARTFALARAAGARRSALRR